SARRRTHLRAYYETIYGILVARAGCVHIVVSADYKVCVGGRILAIEDASNPKEPVAASVLLIGVKTRHGEVLTDPPPLCFGKRPTDQNPVALLIESINE